jgi:hypothetical protein
MLNKIQGLLRKWINGVGKLTLKKERDESGISPKNYNTNITERARYLQRKRINIQLSRGQKLSIKLVKEFNLDILFNPKI